MGRLEGMCRENERASMDRTDLIRKFKGRCMGSTTSHNTLSSSCKSNSSDICNGSSSVLCVRSRRNSLKGGGEYGDATAK